MCQIGVDGKCSPQYARGGMGYVGAWYRKKGLILGCTIVYTIHARRDDERF
jgi:hypothetical protein